MSNSLTAVAQKLSWFNTSTKTKTPSRGLAVKIFCVGRNEQIKSSLLTAAPAAVKERLKQGSSIEKWLGKAAETWVIQSQFVSGDSHYGLFSPSPYAMVRDLVGTCLRQILKSSVKSLVIEYQGESEEEFRGLCVGLEMAHYEFKKTWPHNKEVGFSVQLKASFKNSEKIQSSAIQLGEAVNLARLLVDLPPNILNPKTYAELLKDLFSKQVKTKVTVWDSKRLEKEKMGLHSAVGQAAENKSCMVHIEYRGGGKQNPLAFVGKGITFDAGGLDIKPAAGMRLMKKDMGGSASVAGLAHWVVKSKLKLNCDFYFAIAENSVGSASFRPGDVLTSRSGKTVEIHNTDAEGRLVMADVLTLAAEKKPAFLIDIATLTGAVKYGLGANTPGLFSNHDELAETLLRCGQNRGDIFWRMPLVPQERSRLKSDVADMVNCTDGFGGAITAALFLENFTGGIPWAHFDIYGWNDKPGGPFAHRGGSGQIVQALSDFLTQRALNN